MFQELEEKRNKEGFFPKLHKAVCNAMGEDNIVKLETLRDDLPEMIRFTYNLKCYKDILEIKEFYPEKNGYESKCKKKRAERFGATVGTSGPKQPGNSSTDATILEKRKEKFGT